MYVLVANGYASFEAAKSFKENASRQQVNAMV